MRRLLFWTAIFVIGALTGIAFTCGLIGNRIDALYIENKTLQDNLWAADKQIEQLKEAHKVKKRVISNISTYVEFDKNDYTDFEKNTIKLNVEKNIREWLDIILGQNVENGNYLLIPHIIDNREIEFEKRKIRLKVNMVVVSETVNVYIRVIPINDEK